MSDFNQSLLITIFSRSVGYACGTLIAFLGYRLFVRGYFDKAGELAAIWGKQKLVLKQVAPGAFFALAGVAVIFVTAQHPTQLGENTTQTKSLRQPNSDSPITSGMFISLCNPDSKASATTGLSVGIHSQGGGNQEIGLCVAQAVEIESRQQFKYAKPGEVVLVFPPPSSAHTSPVAGKLEAPKSYPEK